MVLSLSLLLVSFIESFQWVFLSSSHKGKIGCVIVAAFREYALMSLLVVVTCIGIDLCLLVRQPKWLMVIVDIKRKRYRTLLVIYILLTFIFPLLFVPWPFVTHPYGYGSSYYMCWIIPNQCYEHRGFLEQLLLWHTWAVGVWLFTMVIVVIVVLHSMRYRRLTTNSATLFSVMVVFIICILINVAEFIVDAATRMYTVYKYRERLLYVSAIGTPLQVIIASLLLIFRAYRRNLKTAPRRRHYNELNPNMPLLA